MTTPAVEVDACWSRIGVSGDGTCAELKAVIHCRNCAVYARAGRRLLEQSAPVEYLERWAEQLAAAQEEDAAEVLSTVVFRIGDERLALPTTAFAEVVEMPMVHAVPHRTGDVLRGVVNVRGELQLCVSLATLLAIEPIAGKTSQRDRRRLAVIEGGGDVWVFPVDEMVGVHRVARSELAPPPATVARDSSALTHALFELEGEPVALLDADLLFARLRRAIA